MKNFEAPNNYTQFEGKNLEVDPEGFVRFGDIARYFLNQQSQYASRYIDGKIEGYPNLGEGLRFKGESWNYHSVQIHKDDIAEFIKRYIEHQK
ncbi:MAG: hypothetical protein WC441_03980 [Patescibacteria group bacterium]